MHTESGLRIYLRWCSSVNSIRGLRIFEATGTTIPDPGEERGHRVLRVFGKGGRVTLVPLPSAVGRAIDRAIADRAGGPILLNTGGAPMDRHAATRRLHQLRQAAVVRIASGAPAYASMKRTNQARRISR